jgi:hypothetical protein
MTEENNVNFTQEGHLNPLEHVYKAVVIRTPLRCFVITNTE